MIHPVFIQNLQKILPGILLVQLKMHPFHAAKASRLLETVWVPAR